MVMPREIKVIWYLRLLLTVRFGQDSEVQYIWKRNANFDAMKSVSVSYEEERVQADAERQEKANESAIRVSLENEISSHELIQLF
ncbi:hypothetical protein LOK49_LG06G03347 [Camellia lanceoleosa]|uniref:Uncharacterized protein n=1 Tax=Camellia lanceoleosa TaxID=1840588 RepID=A0ACC0H9N8_9ERIC|nr:hypothetical protein LOK49_LG06G03347 [Camellia lanceoleosa]